MYGSKIESMFIYSYFHFGHTIHPTFLTHLIHSHLRPSRL